jgi:CHASE2 domain-containing sensor protein
MPVAEAMLLRSGIGTHIAQQSGRVLLPPAWPVWVLKALVGVVVSLLGGWLLARRSEGRELAAAVASISVSSVFSCLIHCLLYPKFYPKLPGVSPLEFISGYFFLLVGSTLFRRRHSEHPGGLHAT